MRLLWQPNHLPRTMSRREWREIYRWKRVEEKKLLRMERETLRFAVEFNELDMLDRIVNPPLLIHPLMGGI